jgi:hypothetical protein
MMLWSQLENTGIVFDPRPVMQMFSFGLRRPEIKNETWKE